MGLDGAWVFDSVEDADRFAHSIADVGLEWFEDVFPPGTPASWPNLAGGPRLPIDRRKR